MCILSATKYLKLEAIIYIYETIADIKYAIKFYRFKNVLKFNIALTQDFGYIYFNIIQSKV